jgi:aspartyl-tRNA(Asn)/glutamyl-tRNA(Gln) amidotransferase subunit B
MKYQPTIGLEIHAELKTESKMFCDCLNSPMAQEPNIYICPICTGQPGSLPVINQKAVEYTLKTALALNCQIPEFSKFDRKNYFYPDLPKGYQISQYDKPLSVNGYLDLPNLSQIKPNESRIFVKDSETFKRDSGKRIRIMRIHLEEDTGKLIHPRGVDYSLVDFNRAGVPLMELVTEPDIETAKEARQFSQELQLILRYLEVSNADMEKGEMRCEANISLAKNHANINANNKQIKNANKLGTKVEIKNLNSFRSVERAIEYEIKRQSDLLESGEKIVQETRGWDENKQKTFSQRSKEEAEDYRYFPEPDLPILSLSLPQASEKQQNRAPSAFHEKCWVDVEKIKITLPELPQARRERFKKEYQLPEKDIETLVNSKEIANYFEQVCSEFSQTEEAKEKLPLQKLYKLAVNYLLTEIPRIVNELQVMNYELREKITPENFAEFIILVEKGEISSSAAQAVLREMFETKADPTHIIEDKALKQVSSEDELTKIVEQVIKNNPGPVKDYQQGKENALQFLVGKVMRESKGKANPQIVTKILKDFLS